MRSAGPAGKESQAPESLQRHLNSGMSGVALLREGWLPTAMRDAMCRRVCSGLREVGAAVAPAKSNLLTMHIAKALQKLAGHTCGKLRTSDHGA